MISCRSNHLNPSLSLWNKILSGILNIQMRVKHRISLALLQIIVLPCIIPSFYKVPCKIPSNFSSQPDMNIMPRHSWTEFRIHIFNKGVLKVLFVPSLPLIFMSFSVSTGFLVCLGCAWDRVGFFMVEKKVMVIVSSTVG